MNVESLLQRHYTMVAMQTTENTASGGSSVACWFVAVEISLFVVAT
jgi:hypothetical protein